MADLPILFSGPMVRALLDGRKTQTRRLHKPQPETFAIDEYGTPCDVGLEQLPDDPRPRIRVGRVITKQAVRFAVGDRLWVREAWARTSVAPIVETIDKPWIIYREGDARTDYGGPWRSPIHLARKDSRITLIVTDVRVQPLLEISEDDAKAEGFAPGRLNDGFGPRDIGGGYTIESPGGYASAAGMFQITWAKLHPEWDGFSSPYVIALTFEVVKQNIDQIRKAAA